jgi:hypothetical protein
MPAYRLYQVKDGHVLSDSRIIEAESDDAAVAQAKQFLDGCDVELWTGQRLVTTLKGSHHGAH